MTQRRPGMDHALYPFSMLPTRPPLPWPGGARLALGLVVHFDYWEIDPPEGAVSDPRFRDTFGAFRPDQRTYAWREYGNRIGIFRVMEVLDRHGLTATLAAGSAAIARAPQVIEAALARGWEVAAHGDYATRMISSAMPEQAEADLIGRCAEAITAATGTRPAGWIGQDYGESTRTPALLAAAGFRYLCDWPNDDQPYLMTTTPPILSIPVQAELDDVQLLWHRRVPTPRYPDMVAEAADVLVAEGGRSLVLGLHPWLFGMPHRIRYLDAALARLARRDAVWHAPLLRICDHLIPEFGKGHCE
ncbi:MAG TPA: polysaccharide deacetylase family protein [Paracoccaceae bacterium]|nr:polysaccharide deacetylase family protein [Paracoccaceae bacterium]